VQNLEKMGRDLRKLIRGCTGTFHALAPTLKTLQVGYQGLGFSLGFDVGSTH